MNEKTFLVRQVLKDPNGRSHVADHLAVGFQQLLVVPSQQGFHHLHRRVLSVRRQFAEVSAQ